MANIGTFNNQSGALFQDNSITIQQNQQNNMQNAQTTGIADDTDSWKPISLVMDSSHNKVDFYRVIMALYQEGFFKSASVQWTFFRKKLFDKSVVEQLPPKSQPYVPFLFR